MGSNGDFIGFNCIFMGKLIISMAIFNIFLYVYQMVIKRGWLENPRTIQGAKNSWENPSINGELSSKL